MTLLQTLLTTGSSIVLIILLMSYQPGRWIIPAEYSWADVKATVVIALGNSLIGIATVGLVTTGFDWVYAHRMFDMPLNAATICLVFLLDDLCFYVFHRVSHGTRYFWISHSVHHSSRYYNLSIAIRQSWTGRITGQALFWTPLSLLGVPTEWILWQGSVSLLYQFWIHCEGVGRLPSVVEFVFNTPSHHHVHHASNERYIDRNFGGVLIIWDRLFGSFAEQVGSEPCRYGLADGFESSNPIAIVFHEWRVLGLELMDRAKRTARLPNVRRLLGRGSRS